ncbi:PREDICTED: beta-lactamase-like protein 2 homolog isoform X2 [Eufriesea mexicana]|nr:PREDICTED: beta-lactamase-like protein 2 homolog isoform X2 [Eufriesea mexicana]XP_017761926.1 PREDICTED: beta-lactamase-like protein 2 homolog isoform X2 [Eufriesea mexicana]XP_017761927.1 PREDICTED: beta-lactamase-like protein 2 homolog isoform X2 [Eufriesea mexicana]
MTLQGTNTYLVGTGTRRILIDTGGEETAPAYTKLLRDVLGKEKATIEHLLITHWHDDHLGGVNPVLNTLKMLDIKATSRKVWKFQRAQHDKGTSESEKKTSWQNLEDKQTFEVEGAKLRVEYMPGHTSDHATFILEQENALFSGDCILGESTTTFDNLHDYTISLNKILALKTKLIYPGHGPVVKDPEAVINYYTEHRLKRESEILDILQKNAKPNTLSEMDIVNHLYKNISRDKWEAAANNVERHLDKLLKEGRVKGMKGKWQSI